MQTIKNALRIFSNHPIFLAPLFITWIIIASGTIYFKWNFPWEEYSTNQQFLYVYLFYLISSFSLISSCSILVELIEQDEKGKIMSIQKAIRDSFSENLFQLLILSIIWSIIWFFLVLLKVLLSKKKNNGTEEESAENIARTLAGNDSISFSTFTIDMLIKGLRMIMFVIIPAIAWENRSFGKAFNRGFSIISKRTSTFIKGFVVSLGAEIILFLPPSILFYISEKGNIEISDLTWYFCIVYIGFAWSFTMYIEQLFGAELFLWQLKYEKAKKEAFKKGEPIPEFNDVQKPHLLDEIKDLKNFGD